MKIFRLQNPTLANYFISICIYLSTNLLGHDSAECLHGLCLFIGIRIYPEGSVVSLGSAWAFHWIRISWGTFSVRSSIKILSVRGYHSRYPRFLLGLCPARGTRVVQLNLPRTTPVLLRMCLNYELNEHLNNKNCYQNSLFCKAFVSQLCVVANSSPSENDHM